MPGTYRWHFPRYKHRRSAILLIEWTVVLRFICSLNKSVQRPKGTQTLNNSERNCVVLSLQEGRNSEQKFQNSRSDEKRVKHGAEKTREGVFLLRGLILSRDPASESIKRAGVRNKPRGRDYILRGQGLFSEVCGRPLLYQKAKWKPVQKLKNLKNAAVYLFPEPVM